MGISRKLKAVFLDRDGVLNNPVIKEGKPYPPNNVQEVVIPTGVKEGLNEFRRLGYILIMVTNQPDVARGKTCRNIVNQINDYLKDELDLDDVFCCFHDNKDNCECRKPKPGMIFSACKKWEIELEESLLIGDRWKDIECGKMAGVKTFLIDYNYDEKFVIPDYKVKEFREILLIVRRIDKNNE